jgi:hypothetical protein
MREKNSRQHAGINTEGYVEDWLRGEERGLFESLLRVEGQSVGRFRKALDERKRSRDLALCIVCSTQRLSILVR